MSQCRIVDVAKVVAVVGVVVIIGGNDDDDMMATNLYCFKVFNFWYFFKFAIKFVARK